MSVWKKITMISYYSRANWLRYKWLKNPISVVVIFGAVGLSACSTISFEDAYTNAYADEERPQHRMDEAGGVTTFNDYKTLPREVYSALPPKFKVAGLTDHLVVIRDDNGYISYLDGRGGNRVNLSRGVNSISFKNARAIWRSNEWIENKLTGYFNFTAFIRDLDYDYVFEVEHEQDWSNWVIEYFENEQTLGRIDHDNTELRSDIQNATTTLSNLKRREADLLNSARDSRRQGDTYRSRASLTEQEPISPLFDFTTRSDSYDFDEDPFGWVYENNMADAGAENWNIQSAVENTTTHPDTVDAYNNFLDRMNNPLDYYSPEFAYRVSQLTPPSIASLSRSIIHQATLTNPSAAGWLSSNHATGIAVDLGMAGTNYNVRQSNPSIAQEQNYRVFEEVLNDAGFVREVAYSDWRERNHFTLAKYAEREDGQVRPDPNGEIEKARLELRAKYFEMFSDAADLAGEELEQEIGEATNENQTLMDRASELNSDINNQKKKVEKALKDFREAEAYRKKWRKVYQQEQRRRRRDRNRTCFVSAEQLDEFANQREFQMDPINNTLKHHGCGPNDGGPCQ